MTTSLRNLQITFARALRFPGQNTEVSGLLAEDGPLSAEARLDIYRTSIRGQQIKTLQGCFPVVERLLGRDCFLTAAATFLAEPAVNDALPDERGGQFPLFLKSCPWLQQVPFLGDVAALEWALSEIADAENTPAFDFSLLSDYLQAPEILHFALNPSVRLLALEYAADRIWQAHQSEQVMTLDLSSESEPVHLAVWRQPDFTLCFQRIPKRHWTWLTSVVSGRSFAEVCENSGEEAGDIAAELVACLSHNWLHVINGSDSHHSEFNP